MKEIDQQRIILTHVAVKLDCTFQEPLEGVFTLNTRKGKRFSMVMAIGSNKTWVDIRFKAAIAIETELWDNHVNMAIDRDLALAVAVSDKAGEIWLAKWRGDFPELDVFQNKRGDSMCWLPTDGFETLIRDRDVPA